VYKLSHTIQYYYCYHYRRHR